MSRNIIQEPGWSIPVACTDPATPASGDPVRFGAMTGVALTAEGEGNNVATEATIYFGPCVVDVSVQGVDVSGNSAVAVGDAIFYVDADTPKLSKKSTGYFFGFALETISSGATDTIRVLRTATPGGGTLAAGSIGATQLATAAVTAAKLSNTLKTGFIPLNLQDWRLISSNDIAAVGTPDGGQLALDTAPKLKRVNGATDKKLRIEWAAGSAVEITFNFSYPADLDETAPIVINVLAAMAGATDTPTIAVGYFEGVGDTNAGGNTGAVTGTTITKYTRSITAGDVGAYPNTASITLTPATHATDALYVYGIWLEYTRA